MANTWLYQVAVILNMILQPGRLARNYNIEKSTTILGSCIGLTSSGLLLLRILAADLNTAIVKVQHFSTSPLMYRVFTF